MCIAPRSHPHGVRGDLFLTPSPPHKPKKGFSTDLIRTSAPATAFTKRRRAIVFLSRTTLPTPARGKGWNPSAQTFKPFPKQPPFSCQRQLTSAGPRSLCRQPAYPDLLPPKGMGKGSGDGAQKCADGNVAGEGVGDFDLRFVCSASHLWMKQCFTCGGQERE